MIKNIFLALIIWAAAWAQEKEESLNALKKLAQAGREKISKAEIGIGKAKEKFDEIAKDRLESLQGEYQVQRNALEAKIAEAVSQGILKDKKFSNFQCIANSGQETFDKLDALRDLVPQNYERIRHNRLAAVYSYKSVLTGLKSFISDYYNQKCNEIRKSEKVETIKKILADVEGKIKLLGSIADQIFSNVNSFKFQFFEEFVNFAHQTDNNLKKIQREGAQRIMFCVF